MKTEDGKQKTDYYLQDLSEREWILEAGVLSIPTTRWKMQFMAEFSRDFPDRHLESVPGTEIGFNQYFQ